MQQIKISELKSHPRNTEFFDDISGEKWTEFLESIKTSGVIEPVIITAEKIIVSGHQRTRACKELGIESVLCEVHAYENEDQILKDLLETNIRQRGDVGGSAKKVGKRIKELERLYGIRNGSAGGTGVNQYTKELERNNFAQATQETLASDLGIEVRTLQNYKLLADMIPELEDLLDTGIVTKTTALAIMKNLSDSEQEELISSMDTTKRITQKQVQQYIDEIKGLEEKIADQDIDDLVEKKEKAQESERKMYEKLQTQKKENEELKKKAKDSVENEVVPDDYEETKLMLEGITEIKERLEEELNEAQQELAAIKSELDMQKRLVKTTSDERAITSTNMRNIKNEILAVMRPFTIMKDTYVKLPVEDQHEIHLSVEKIQECIDEVKTQLISRKVG